MPKKRLRSLAFALVSPNRFIIAWGLKSLLEAGAVATSAAIPVAETPPASTDTGFGFGNAAGADDAADTTESTGENVIGESNAGLGAASVGAAAGAWAGGIWTTDPWVAKKLSG